MTETDEPTGLEPPREPLARWLDEVPTALLVGAGVFMVVCGVALAALALSGDDEVTTDPPPEEETGDPEPPRTIPEEQTAAEDVVLLELGTDLQATVDQYEPGTEFLVEAGVHREQWIRPRDGDVFRGQDGAVLNGSRVLEGFERDGDRWRVGGQTQSSTPLGDQVLDGRDVVRFYEELFIDDGRVTRVGSIGEVGPGTWFLDTEADTIWIGDDPTDRAVETSVSKWAFREEGVADVTIENLTVERYANRSSRGAINPDNSPRWTIRDVTARQNHGAGIGIGPGTVVEGADIVGNGQIGLAGNCDFRDSEPNAGESILVEVRDSRIRENGTIGFDWEWEGGGLKIKFCKAGVVFEDNWVHDNTGPGIWLDIDNADAQVRRNLAERNSVSGIFYEISFGESVIEANISRDNGGDPSPSGLDAGIVVSNSPDVTVRDNLVHGNPVGLLVRYAERGSSDFGGERVTDDLLFADNVVAFDRRSGVEAWFQPERVRDEFDIRFRGNRYVLDDPDADLFVYDEDDIDFSRWQELGFDTDGRVVRSDGQPPSLPDGVETFTEAQRYGARG